MRISDWSSDVCSSDLLNSLQIVELSRKFGDLGEIRDHARRTLPEREALAANRELYARPRPSYLRAEAGSDGWEVSDMTHTSLIEHMRSDVRRVGTVDISTVISWWTPYPHIKTFPCFYIL